MSAVQRVAHALEGASQRPAQRVFTQLYADTARATAQSCDAQAKAGRNLGALHGVCITVKDNIDVAGETTMAGGVVCTGEAPALHDAPVVQRLRKPGRIPASFTTFAHFAMSSRTYLANSSGVITMVSAPSCASRPTASSTCSSRRKSDSPRRSITA